MIKINIGSQLSSVRKNELFEIEVDEYFNIKSLYQTTLGMNKLPIDKFIIASYPYKYNGSPFGVSVYKEIYTDVIIKNKIEELRNKGLEFTLVPSIIAYYPNLLPKEDKQTFIREIQKLRNSTITTLGVPELEDGKLNKPEIDILSDRIKRDGFDITSSAINMIEARIRRKLGIPDKIGFSDDKTGSYSQSKTNYDSFTALIEDTHRWICNIVNLEIIPKIVRFNFNTPDDYKLPKMAFDELDEVLTETKVNIATSLINSNIIKNNSEWLSTYLGIPKQELNVHTPDPSTRGEQEDNSTSLEGARGSKQGVDKKKNDK